MNSGDCASNIRKVPKPSVRKAPWLSLATGVAVWPSVPIYTVGVVSLGYVMILHSLCFLHLAKPSERFPSAKCTPIHEHRLTGLW